MNRVYYNEGQSEISYTLTRKKVKNINLRVNQNGVFVSAPTRISLEKINEFVLSKAEWILEAQEKFSLAANAGKENCPLEYKDGDIICFLGKPLELRVVKEAAERVTIDEKFIYLHLRDIDDLNRKSKLIAKWRNEKCIELFTKISDDVYSRFEKYKTPYPLLKFREMTSRWGSCQVKKGIITLNKKLLEKPYPAIEYVIVHEYAHFIVPNHSKQFYELVEKFLPDYKERKKALR